eukprot:6473846-Amphidinium_carterae.1
MEGVGSSPSTKGRGPPLSIFMDTDYCTDDALHPEKNRKLIMDVMSSVAGLGNRLAIIVGDWNFEADEMLIDLVHGDKLAVL